jgi:hypothetical protein
LSLWLRRQEFEPEDAAKRNFSGRIKSFVKTLLNKNPKERPSASRCLTLPFLKNFANRSEVSD